MRAVGISNPIINSPFREPTRPFLFDSGGNTNDRVEGRWASACFTGGNEPYAKLKRALRVEIDEDA